MFSICTAYIEDGKLKETLKQFSESEKKFTKEIGVRFRKFFQCLIQPHIIWSITEWDSEKSHHDAAQSIMQTRRDDRFVSIGFGPEPYFEIFCGEDEKQLPLEGIEMTNEELEQRKKDYPVFNFKRLITAAGIITVILATIVNILLNLIIIPLYGILGAALVAVVTELVVLIIQYSQFRKLPGRTPTLKDTWQKSLFYINIFKPKGL